VRTIQQQFAAGDMTPNQRTAALHAANQERAERLDRVGQQMDALM
jgi:hypothetical protein